MSVLLKKRIVTFFYHLLVVIVVVVTTAIGKNINNQTMVNIAMLTLWADVLTFRLIPLSRYLTQWIISTAACYGCGHVIDLKSLWQCSGCRFRSFKERHLFKPCVQCGKVPKWLICPVCETSIPM